MDDRENRTFPAPRHGHGHVGGASRGAPSPDLAKRRTSVCAPRRGGSDGAGAAGWVGRNHGDRTQAQVDRDVCEAKGGMAGTQATLAGRAQGAAADMSVGHGAAAANVRTRCIKLYAIVATQSLS